MERDASSGASDRTPETATVETAPEPVLEGGGLAQGQRLGPYEIAGKIGAGGMGTVYRATDTRLNRAVAIKVISREGNSFRRRFFLEAKAASALNHPNIVTIYEYNSAAGFDYLVMEYLEGQTLDCVAVTHPPLPDLLRYACQAAAAIERAHRAGIVHRDLKPGNIMVIAPSGEPGAVKVLDFGLAKYAPADDGDSAESLTRTGVSVGTPAYMSPEQAKAEPADFRSDIFSFGIVLYELACGSRPFHGTTRVDLLHAIVHGSPQRPPDVPRPLMDLIEQCLAKDPSLRPRSMQEIHDRLNCCLSELAGAPPAAPATAEPRARRIATRVGVLAATLIAVIGTVWFLSRPAPPHRILKLAIEAQTPGSPPRAASPSETFLSGSRFRLRLESPQSGFLYVITLGPGEDGTEHYWILYPRAARTAPQPANQSLETGWFDFDNNPGIEHLWTVWAQSPVPALDGALRLSASGEVAQGPAANLGPLLNGAPHARELNLPNLSLQLTSDQTVLTGLIDLRHR